jgi:F-type H+-transporting ATPase subunit b
MNPLVQPDPGLYLWTIFVFLVLAALLAKFAWRPLLDALEARQAGIRKSLEDARAAAEALDKTRIDAERVVAEARVEASRIVARTREDAERVRQELKAKAESEAARLVENAERQIQLETRKAVEEVRKEAVDLSFAIAEKLLQRNVSKEDNARLVDDALSQIGSSKRVN